MSDRSSESRRPADVDVVIVLFHSDARLLRTCLLSVERAAAFADVVARVVFVDNGGGVPDLGEDLAIPFVLVGDGRNDGFGRAVNSAFAVVDAPRAILLNPDAALEEGAIAAFLRAAQEQPGSLLAGTMLTTGRIDPDSVLDWDFSIERRLKRRSFATPVDASGVAVRVEKATGGALFAESSRFRELGPFDEQFFLYAEDADLSRRAVRQGVGVFRVADARVQHVGSASARSFAALVEFARADAAIRLTASHRSRVVSLAQRGELLVVTLLGMLVERDPDLRKARAARLRALRLWGLLCRRPGLDASELSDLA
ncbi:MULTISPECIES: glycosyltransferase [unclassified Curtobacterium]|uniref:glycosyltransferase n=1 Tax=Curtobacterium sp. MCPF17_046 TaxID=2175663 RepID=UPI000D948219|nr:hypothetical protein DEJ32_09115 [Curtobacterium sp. MCPF17_046]